MKLLVFVIFLVFLNEPSCILADVDCQQCTKTCNNSGMLHTLIYLISFFLCLMLIIICILCALLYKVMRQKNNAIITPSQVPLNDNVPSCSVIKKKSEQMTILEINNSKDLKNSIHESRNCSATELVEKDIIKINKVDKMPGSTHDFQINRTSKKQVDQKGILKEQMKLICEAALAKAKHSGVTVSLEDLNNLLENGNVEASAVLSEIVKEGFKSQPDLEIYELNPSNKPIEEIYGNVELNVSNDDLSSGATQEPAYINARYILKK